MTIVAFFSIMKIVPNNLIRVDLKEYNLVTDKDSILVGGNENCDVSLPDIKIEDEHLRIDFSENNYSLHNIAKAKKVDVNNRYISSIELNVNDTLRVGNDYYIVTEKPKFRLIGISGKFEDLDGNEYPFFNQTGKSISLNKIFHKNSNLYKNYYLKLQFNGRGPKMFFDTLVLVILGFSFFLLISFVGKKKIDRDSAIMNFLFAIIVILAVIFLLNFDNVTPYLKIMNYNLNHEEIISINGNSVYSRNKTLSYQGENRIIAGYTKFGLSVQNDSLKIIKIVPQNSSIFLTCDKDEMIIGDRSNPDVDLSFTFIDSLKTERIVVDEQTNVKIGNDFNNMVLNIERVSKVRIIYYFLLLGIALISFLFVLIEKKSAFKINSIFLIVFSFILLQGIILSHQYSYFNLKDSQLFGDFIRNIILGTIFFLMLYIVINFRFIKYKYASRPSVKFFHIFSIFFSLFLLGLSYGIELFWLTLVLSFVMCFFVFMRKRNSKQNKMSLINFMASLEGIHVVKMLIAIIGILIIQTIVGGELGFNFISMNIQIIEFVKILLTMTLVLALHAIYSNENNNIPVYLPFIVPLIVLVFLSSVLHDFSPAFIFSMIFIVSVFLNKPVNQNEDSTGSNKKDKGVFNNYYRCFIVFSIILIFGGLASRENWMLLAGIALLIFIVSVFLKKPVNQNEDSTDSNKKDEQSDTGLIFKYYRCIIGFSIILIFVGLANRVNWMLLAGIVLLIIIIFVEIYKLHESDIYSKMLFPESEKSGKSEIIDQKSFFSSFKEKLNPYFSTFNEKLNDYPIYWKYFCIFLVIVILPIFIIIYHPSLPPEFKRFIMWTDHWRIDNAQFAQAFFFLRNSKPFVQNLTLVPVLDDDMVFSLYLNRFGLFHFISLFILPLTLLLMNIRKYFVSWEYLGEKKQILSLQIAFLTILFVVQHLIVLSNVTGLFPIMGQPAPGISYGASNLIFFFFGILLILLVLDSEFQNIKTFPLKLSRKDKDKDNDERSSSQKNPCCKEGEPYEIARYCLLKNGFALRLGERLEILEPYSANGAYLIEHTDRDGKINKFELDQNEREKIVLEKKIDIFK